MALVGYQIIVPVVQHYKGVMLSDKLNWDKSVFYVFVD